VQIDVFEFTRVPSKIQAVQFDGSKEQARLLIKSGWLDGSDLGFGRADTGGIQLRGHIERDGERLLAFRGDIVTQSAAGREVWERPAFEKEFSDPVLVLVLTDAIDEVPTSAVPTGENPDAVNLEPAHETE
jgi:hypothetical protein